MSVRLLGKELELYSLKIKHKEVTIIFVGRPCFQDCHFKECDTCDDGHDQCECAFYLKVRVRVVFKCNKGDYVIEVRDREQIDLPEGDYGWIPQYKGKHLKKRDKKEIRQFLLENCSNVFSQDELDLKWKFRH